jgi:DNA-binding transcriptional LysR family regulator
MDPRRLLTFRTVAHERSFSRAATTLSLSQPSVSHQVALLETEIGLRLLDRGRGGLRLTRAGEVLLEHADNVAWRLQLAEAQIAVLAEERRGHVRLGAFPTALAGFVPSAVERLRSTQGDLRVVLSEVTPSTLEPRFLGGEFDIAIGYQDAATERREYQDAERVDLLQETFLIGLPLGHPLAGETGPVSLSRFASDDWIVPSAEGFLMQACRDAGFEPHVVATSAGPLVTRGLIARGIGIGWVPSLLADDYPDMAVRAIDGPMRRRDIYALLPPGDRHPLSATVVTALVETANEVAGVPATLP